MATIKFGKLIVIEDSLSINAKDILDFTLSDNTDPVEILTLEKSPKQWKKLFPDKTNYNYHTDIKELTGRTSDDKPHVVVIYSVNHLAALTDWETTLGYIDNFTQSNTTKRLIIVVHTDCLLYGNKMIKQLRYMCQTCITLKEKINTNRYLIKLQNSSAGGKITKTSNNLCFDPQLKSWTCMEVKKEEEKREVIKKDMNSFTSFKIGVDKSAEIVKNDLILPYTETNRSDGLILKPDFDDWDDEDDDPDDDLNI